MRYGTVPYKYQCHVLKKTLFISFTQRLHNIYIYITLNEIDQLNVEGVVQDPSSDDAWLLSY